ncbi:MAG: hypothetical protein II320_00620 [Oscillospiraceae bacterium]|jgi:cell division protein FtsB|nr:hypothetical protein [Oscillospiraceae bacterium]MBQ2383403.1 hypothetical protein [Oscillospiraceae bacterium]
MDRRKKQKYKIVFRPGKTLTKVALLVVIALSTMTLIAIGSAVGRGQDRVDALRAQAQDQEQVKAALEKDIAALGSEDSIRDIAEQELGLVDPDTIIFVNDDQ